MSSSRKETQSYSLKHAESSTLKRSEEHTSELQSRLHLVCRLLLEKKKKRITQQYIYTNNVKRQEYYSGDLPKDSELRDVIPYDSLNTANWMDVTSNIADSGRYERV